MAMVLNEEQEMLKDAAAEFCRKRSPIEKFRELRDAEDANGYSPELWNAMVEMGWTGAAFPETLSGYDFGYQGLGVILEETGRTLVNSPLFSTVALSGSIVLTAGSDDQRSAIIPEIVNGEKLIATAIDEGPRHNPSSVSCTATKSGDGYTISGVKKFVLDGHVANQFIVSARTSGDPDSEQGITLFLVDANASGIKITRSKMVDSRNSAIVEFDNTPVADVLGDVDGGFVPLDAALDRARICLAAEMLGSLTHVFGITIEYLKTRIQFDVPIGSFQALQHRAAELYGEVEMAKSVVLEALTAIDAESSEVPMLASLAKAKLNDIFALVSSEAIQLHGGIGMTDECDVGFYLKRSRVASQTLGDSRFHRDRFATLMGY